MDERTGTLVKDLFEARQNLGDNLAQLETKVRDVTNWRTYFNQKPWMMMGLALGGGFLLAAILTPPRRNCN